MTVIEAIEKRRSVRTFDGRPLSDAHVAELKEYISQLTPPFGAQARIVLVHTDDEGKPVKLGTYGIIKGVGDYMALIHKDGPMGEYGAGYMFEQAVLKCTQMGLGTCWLGGTVNRDDFIARAKPTQDEKLLLVSPVGYPAPNKRLMEKVMRAGAGSNSRKPFEKLFFAGSLEEPLFPANAGIYSKPLEMVRLAPSASNTQPWRIIINGAGAHFFYKNASRFSGFDIGIALCHFELSCRELGIEGHFKVLKAEELPPSGDNIYAISWVK